MPIKQGSIKFIIFISGIFVFTNLSAQEYPPFPVEVEVRTAQFLNFGSFTVGPSGGTVSVGYNGERNSTGDVQLMSIGHTSVSYAIFDVYANPGTIIQIQQPPEIQLTGPSGSMVTLRINPELDIESGRTFIVTQNPHPVYVGGTLSIPNGVAGPAGNYNGNITLTFIHQ